MGIISGGGYLHKTPQNSCFYSLREVTNKAAGGEMEASTSGAEVTELA